MDVDVDAPLDFESEDVLLNEITASAKKKRRKVIGLDDLLDDFYKESKKHVDQEAKKAKKKKAGYEADDHCRENQKEAQLFVFVDKFEKQVKETATEDDIPLWGLRVFGDQKALPPAPVLPALDNCDLFKSLNGHEVIQLLGLKNKKGEEILEELLTHDWLCNLCLINGRVDSSVASLTYYLMLYSLNEKLQASACDFWCSILSQYNEVDSPVVHLHWIPGYSELKDALDIHGYIRDFQHEVHRENLNSDQAFLARIRSIKYWVKFISSCCQSRKASSIFEVHEVEELVIVILSFFLDRRLQGIWLLLQECLPSVLSFFNDQQWEYSLKRIARSVARSIPKDLNCVRVVDCISVVDLQSKLLRSEVAFQILSVLLDNKDKSAEDTVTNLSLINIKDRKCTFLQLYLYLVLGDNWLLYCGREGKASLLPAWVSFLRNCSCHITSTDFRPYASKVRNKASYLVQIYQSQLEQQL